MRAVHLAENSPLSKRSLTTGRAYPLGEAGRPTGRDLAAIVRYLDVERSPRYQPTAKSTFCNVYACDYCYLAGVYLPRVWWIRPGVDQAVRYGETVAELNANALYAWLCEFGAGFGWARVDTLDRLQEAANAGHVCVISAHRRQPERSGHISVVVPEQPGSTAERRDGRVRLPLQSQAGVRNFNFGCGLSRWWEGAAFRAWGFWVNG